MRILIGRLKWGRISQAALIATLLSVTAEAGSRIEGQVLALNGDPLHQAMVTLTKDSGQGGPTAVTVFTDAQGRFAFPESTPDGTVDVRKLGYRMIDEPVHAKEGKGALRIVMRPEANQAGIAPASAWLASANPDDRTQLVMNCVGCHQMPAPEVRAYAKLIHDLPTQDRHKASEQSWHAMVQYMNYVSAWEFGRGASEGPPDPNRVYSGGEAAPMAAALARTVKGPMQRLEGYDYGAPLLVNERTVIREYEVPAPNAIREALTLADPRTMWVADVSSNRLFRVDTITGEARPFTVPTDRAMGPHTLLGARDGALWIMPFFNGVVARLDPKKESWQVWNLEVEGGRPAGVHDFTFGYEHELLTDKRGRIWYSDIVHNAVGWFDPKTGRSAIYKVPPVPGRTGGEALYGIVMSRDRTHIWYSQLGIGRFGSFNVETLQFETAVELPDRHSGPRRLAISDQDVLYVPLYGAGQLVEYDTRARRMIGVYDLPDRASAPYAVTWDAKRKVVWIPTSNGNVIYRFDPRDKSFAVLPLPREGAFLRMLGVDRNTGALVTSYANIVEYVHGPRMALMIHVGDAEESSR